MECLVYISLLTSLSLSLSFSLSLSLSLSVSHFMEGKEGEGGKEGGIFTFRFLPVWQSRLLTPAEEEEDEAAAAAVVVVVVVVVEEEEEGKEGKEEGMCVVGWGGDGFRFRAFDNNSGWKKWRKATARCSYSRMQISAFYFYMFG